MPFAFLDALERRLDLARIGIAVALLFIVANAKLFDRNDERVDPKHAYFSRGFVYLFRISGGEWVHAIAKDWMGIHRVVCVIRHLQHRVRVDIRHIQIRIDGCEFERKKKSANIYAIIESI